MKIEWNRLLADALPALLRQPRAMAFLRVVQSPYRDLYQRALEWGEGERRRAAYDSSAIMIERLLLDQMGLRVEVVTAPAPPLDFIVRIVSTEAYDEARLRALVDRYKPADKKYRIEGGQVAYTARFEEHVCELTELTYSVVFHSWVCELTERAIVDNPIRLIVESRTGEAGVVRYVIFADAQMPVASDVRIITSDGLEFLIARGDERSNEIDLSAAPDPMPTIITIEPEKDSDYYYVPYNLK